MPDSIIENPTFMLKTRKTLSLYVVKLTQQWRDLIWPVVKLRFDRPVFVVGCSRSGTTAVYHVLGMASELSSMHKESHAFWDSLHPLSDKNWDSHILTATDVTERSREEVARFFYRNLGEARFLDKANQNCFRIHYLHELFPDAFFVYIKRDGRDNINSLIHGWGKPDEFGTWSHNLPANVQIENGTYQRWCFFLFPEWQAFLNARVEDVCAQQWIEANQAVLSAKAHIPSSQWVEIFYEDILRSPVEAFQRVFKQLDLSFRKDIRNHCINLASKPYNAFSPPRIEKWKEENREQIERIIQKISGTMAQMGYKI